VLAVLGGVVGANIGIAVKLMSSRINLLVWQVLMFCFLGTQKKKVAEGEPRGMTGAGDESIRSVDSSR
jgi:hypothetical protein